jgi:drug/metabolite transporter (DMT)-like permease
MHGASKARVSVAATVKAQPVDKIGWIAILGTGIIAWSGVLARFLDVGPLAGAAWRMGLAVPALAIWARLISGRRMSLAQPAAFAFPPALALFGSWVMAGMAAPLRLGYGDIFALCTAISYAAYLLVIKRVRVRLDGPTATLWSAAVSAIALALAATLRGEILLPHSALGWTIAVLLGVVSHAMGQGLTSVAIGRVSVGLLALVILAQPPFSALLAWLVLGETMTVLQMAGGAIILTAVFLARPK